MGQQQLLLLTLGVIIVSITVVAGIGLFSTGAVSANRDAVVNDLSTLATQAQSFYKKTELLGGGGFSFVGFTIPSQLDTIQDGTFSIRSISSDNLVIRGVGVEKAEGGFGCSGSTRNITHDAYIAPTSLSVVKVY